MTQFHLRGERQGRLSKRSLFLEILSLYIVLESIPIDCLVFSNIPNPTCQNNSCEAVVGDTYTSSSTLLVLCGRNRISSLRKPSSVAVLLILTLLSCPLSPILGAGNSVTFLLSLSTPLGTPNPNAPYPFRRGLDPRDKVSNDILEGNCPAAASGEGKGTNPADGI